MSLALLFPDDSVLYLDSVQNYTKSRRSRISSQPVDASAVISDHVSKNNPRFTIEGVISAADFATNRRPFTNDEGNAVGEQQDRIPVNDILINQQSSLLQYLPGSIQQFIGAGQQPATITADAFRGYSHQLARDRLEQAWETQEEITIIDEDYDFVNGRSSSIRVIGDCQIADYEDMEGVDTGDSLAFRLTFDKVRYAFIKEIDIQISQAPAASVADEASPEDNKGDQTGTTDPSPDVSNDGGRQTQFDQLVEEGGVPTYIVDLLGGGS